MEYQKLFLSAATGCLLLGASGGAALAQEEDVTCESGIINNETVNNITVDGRSCFVSETIVLGSVTVTNSPTFAMSNNTVHGSVSVTGDGDENVLINRTRVFNGPLTVTGAAIVWIFNNPVGGGTNPETANAVFQDNTDEVEIFHNVVNGDLLCANNNFVATSGNIVRGSDTCAAQ